MDDLVGKVSALQERCVSINDKIDAAHRRIDSTEALVRDELKSLRGELVVVKEKLAEVTNAIHRAKGFGAAILIIAGLTGTVLGHLIVFILT